MLRQAVRALRRSPLFSASIILITAVTIALASTSWALVRQVIFEPLPYRSPENVVAIWDSYPDGGQDKFRVSAANYLAWRERQAVFESMALIAYTRATLLGEGEPVALRGAEVTAGFFTTLGVQAASGRLFSESDFEGTASDVVVLSHELWVRDFDSDPTIVGRSIRLDESRPTVIGVMPDIVMPLTAWSSGRIELSSTEPFFWRPRRIVRENHSHVYGAIARLADDMTLQSARAQMNQIAAVLANERPDSNEGIGVVVLPLADEAAPPLVRRALWMVATAAGLLVLLACANVANLYLLRALARQRTLAVRAALGANRGDLWRLLVTELLTLSMSGALIAIPLTISISRVVHAMPAIDLPQWSGAEPGLGLVIAVGGIAISFALVASLGPLLLLRRMSLAGVLRTRGEGAPPSLDRLRRVLVAGEVALTVVLLIGAALLAGSLARIRGIDPGFDSKDVLTVRLDLPAYRYEAMDDVTGFWNRLRDELRAMPDIDSAGAAYDLPIDANWLGSFSVVSADSDPAGGASLPSLNEAPTALFRTVTPGAMEALRMTLIDGRFFDDSDVASSPGVAIVNESLARRYFGTENPLGQELDIHTTQWLWGEAIPTRFRIVGVVGDVSFEGLTGGSAPAYYLPFDQTPHYGMRLFVRSRTGTSRVVDSVRRVVRDIDPELPVDEIKPLVDVVDDSISKPRLYAQLLGAFAAAAGLLTMFGLATVLTATLRERTRELGLRAALGATSSRIFVHAVVTGLRPVLVGLTLGLVGSAMTSRLVRSILFDLEPLDIATYAVVSVSFIVLAVIVCAPPAIRAARVDPMRVLRED